MQHTIKWVITTSFSLSLLALMGCPKGISSLGSGKNTFESRSQSGTILADVGGVTLSAEGLAEVINKQGPFLKKQLLGDTEKQKKFLDSQIKQELLVQEALKRGYMGDTEVQDGIRRLLLQKITKEEFNKLEKTIQIDDTEAKVYFDKNVGEFNKPEKRKIEVIWIPYTKDRAKALQLAQKAAKDAKPSGKHKGRPDFDSLQKTYYEEAKKLDPNVPEMPSRLSSYMSKEEAIQALGEKAQAEAWKLANNDDVTGVVEGKDCFYVLQRSSIREASSRDFESVKEAIKRRLLSEKRREIFTATMDKMQKDTGVVINEKNLSKFNSLIKMTPEDEQELNSPDPLSGLKHRFQ